MKTFLRHILRTWLFLVLLPGLASAYPMGNSTAVDHTSDETNVITGSVFLSEHSFMATTMVFTVNVSIVSSGDASFDGAVYAADGSSVPTARLATTGSYSFSSSGTYTVNAPISVPIIAGQRYYLCVNSTGSGDYAYVNLSYASDGNETASWNRPFGFGSWPDDFMGTVNSDPNARAVQLTGPDYTSTVTPSLTATPSYTYTSTSTVTVTDTPSPTNTESPTSTITPTFTMTPTITPSATRTATLTISPSCTKTCTPTQTLLVPRQESVAYPQPASGKDLWFYYIADQPGDTVIEIYNVVGEKVETLTVRSRPGANRLRWDLTSVGNGVYFYRIKKHTSEAFSALMKFIVARKQ